MVISSLVVLSVFVYEGHESIPWWAPISMCAFFLVLSHFNAELLHIELCIKPMGVGLNLALLEDNITMTPDVDTRSAW